MSALPIPAPPHTERQEPPTRNGRKPVKSESRPRARRSSTDRAFEGKRFVGFETAFLDKIRHGSNSLAEQNLILFVAEMSNEQKTADLFGWTAYIMPSVLADEIECTTQNINYSASLWFYNEQAAAEGKPTGLIERAEQRSGKTAKGVRDVAADSRAFAYRIRLDYLDTWSKHRRDARARAKAARLEEAERRRLASEAEPPEADSATGARYRLPKPVRVGPLRPFKLPRAAQEAIQEGCTAITTRQDGTITEFSIEGEVLFLGFDAAPQATAKSKIDKSTCRLDPSSPSKNTPKIDKSTCRSPETVVDNKELTKSRRAKAQDLRDDLDRLLMQKIGGAIDDVIFRKVVDQLGGADAITPERVAELKAAIRGRFAMVRSWPFLVTPAPKTRKSLVMMARLADERRAALGPAEVVEEPATPRTSRSHGDEAFARKMRQKYGDGGDNA